MRDASSSYKIHKFENDLLKVLNVRGARLTVRPRTDFMLFRTQSHTKKIHAFVSTMQIAQPQPLNHRSSTQTPI